MGSYLIFYRCQILPHEKIETNYSSIRHERVAARFTPFRRTKRTPRRSFFPIKKEKELPSRINQQPAGTSLKIHSHRHLIRPSGHAPVIGRCLPHLTQTTPRHQPQIIRNGRGREVTSPRLCLFYLAPPPSPGPTTPPFRSSSSRFQSPHASSASASASRRVRVCSAPHLVLFLLFFPVIFCREGLICVFRGPIRRFLIDLRCFLVIFLGGVDSLGAGILRAVESRRGQALEGFVG